MKAKKPREGELFSVVVVENHRFEIRYGYYEESDRKSSDPVPIYPDLKNHTIYTKEGHPLVTAIQSPCENYKAKEGYEDEDYCSNCIFYPDITKEISVCLCQEQRLSDNT